MSDRDPLKLVGGRGFSVSLFQRILPSDNPTFRTSTLDETCTASVEHSEGLGFTPYGLGFTAGSKTGNSTYFRVFMPAL